MGIAILLTVLTAHEVVAFYKRENVDHRFSVIPLGKSFRIPRIDHEIKRKSTSSDGFPCDLFGIH